MRAELTHAFELLRRRDPQAVEQAIELLQNTVFSFSMTVCGHKEDAEDTMQEVLLKSVPYLERFDSPAALSTWLYKVARNRCWMSRRRSKFAPREHLSLEELMPDADEMQQLAALPAASGSQEKAAIATQELARVQQAILKVPPSYRLVLVLHDVEELSTGEIAQVLNLTEGNVRIRLHRARLFLRKQLAQHTAPEFISNAPKGAVNGGGKGSRNREGRTCSPRCKQIFRNLSEYLDGALDETLCSELERHMSGCKPCQSFLDSLRNSVEHTHSIPRQSPDAHVSAAARAQMRRQSKQGAEPRIGRAER